MLPEKRLEIFIVDLKAKIAGAKKIKKINAGSVFFLLTKKIYNKYGTAEAVKKIRYLKKIDDTKE